MTIWEKAVLNIQRGAQRVTMAAALFSERVRVEIAVVRIRIRINEVNARIDEIHRTIGARIAGQHSRAELPRTCEQFVKDDEMAALLNELVDRRREVDELSNEVLKEVASLKPATPSREGNTE